MSKRWTHKDDLFLVRFHEVGADYVASHDLGFAKGAGSKRLAKLKETGVFDKIQEYIKAEKAMLGWHQIAFSQSPEARQIAFEELIDDDLPVPVHLISVEVSA